LLSYQPMPELFQTHKMEKQKIASFGERRLRQMPKSIPFVSISAVFPKIPNKNSRFFHSLPFCGLFSRG
ncbi:MAG: hypothetical protein ACRECY_12640, partial [Phyllobacterium sp.]